MPTHDDDDPVMIKYESNRNISFQDEEELGYTWGEWRAMSRKRKDEAITTYLYELVDVYVKDDIES